jgi:hypothetical protein
MVRIQEQIDLIEKTKKKIEIAERNKNWKAKNDLVKFKNKLVLELEEAERYLRLK